MSGAVILARASDLLPEGYASPKILAALSSDGQIYCRVAQGKREARVESWEAYRLRDSRATDTVLKSPKKSDGGRRKKGRNKMARQGAACDWIQQIVRHLIREHWDCRDCKHQEQAVHFLWSERRCSCCWSCNIDVTESRLVPERPAQFANIGTPFLSWHNMVMKTDPSKHKWGRSADKDAWALRALEHSYRIAHSGHAHVYLLLLFAETLIRLPRYAAGEVCFNLTLNVGNISQRYFQLTGSVDAARWMLDYFQRAAELMDDPVPVSLAKHSFGMATIYLLNTYDESQAELITGRLGLRSQACIYLREALELVLGASERDVKGAKQQTSRIRYALADLLRSGRASEAERRESQAIFRDLPESEMGQQLAAYVRAARAENWLESNLPAELNDKELQPYLKAASDLIEMIRSVTPLKLQHRWHWALTVGQFLLRLGRSLEALPYLQAAVTFVLKDTAFHIDPLTVTNDSERYFRAFSVLAGLYAEMGWWFESLSLLETYRGRVIELRTLTDEKRHEQRVKSEKARNEKYFGMFPAQDSPSLIIAEEASWEESTGRMYGPFAENYELPELSDRLKDLFRQMRDEDTLLISLSIDDTTIRDRHVLSAVILGPPRTPRRPGKYRVWKLSQEDMQALTSDIYGRTGSFREGRLKTLGDLIFAKLLKPMEEDLKFFGCKRALLVTSSQFSNLPFEAYRVPKNYRHRGLLPVHFAFTPSFMFGSSYRPRRRHASKERLLIVGYQGSDLPAADEEARLLSRLFGGRAHYLDASDTNKRQVSEALNDDYDYIHFISHGTYNREHPGESALYFRDLWKADAYRLLARELREFVRFKNRPVITLSACSTALTADSRSNTWHGLPGSFLESGARCVIGTRWPVADRAARELMAQLYTQLITTPKTPLQCFHAVQDKARAGGRLEEWACFGYLGLP